jgi:hypothetical protein
MKSKSNLVSCASATPAMTNFCESVAQEPERDTHSPLHSPPAGPLDAHTWLQLPTEPRESATDAFVHPHAHPPIDDS